MSLLSSLLPKCPTHFTWMQPTLKPRQWRCNVPMIGGPRCPESESYRWWRPPVEFPLRLPDISCVPQGSELIEKYE